MNNANSPLQIIYTGEPVRVDPGRITKEMYVPRLGWGATLPGKDVVTLFTEAESKRALVVPGGIFVDCYSRDPHEAHDFMLVAYPAGQCRAGVTNGWYDVELLAKEQGDPRPTNDPAVVREALEVMAAKINSALNAE
jgi:hypothetical protein